MNGVWPDFSIAAAASAAPILVGIRERTVLERSSAIIRAQRAKNGLVAAELPR